MRSVVNDDGHAMLVALPQRLDSQRRSTHSGYSPIAFGREEPLGRGVVDMKVALDVLYTGANGGGV